MIYQPFGSPKVPEKPSTATRTCRCDSSTSSCKQSAATSLLAVSSSDPVRAVARPVVILPCGDFWENMEKTQRKPRKVVGMFKISKNCEYL